MKKITLLLPLLLFSTFQNSTCMHRKSMKRMHKQKQYKNKKSFNQISKKKKFEQHKKTAKAKKTKKKNKVLDRFLKASSKKSYVPKHNVSLRHKDLISMILFFYIIFNQPIKCQFNRHDPWLGQYDSFLGKRTSSQSSSDPWLNKESHKKFEKNHQKFMQENRKILDTNSDFFTQKQPTPSQQPMHYSSTPSPNAIQRAEASLAPTIMAWMKSQYENAKRWEEHVKKICNFWRAENNINHVN